MQSRIYFNWIICHWKQNRKQRKIKRFEIFRFRKTSSGRNNKLSFLIKNLYLIFWFEGRNKWGRHVKQQNLISSSKRERNCKQQRNGDNKWIRREGEKKRLWNDHRVRREEMKMHFRLHHTTLKHTRTNNETIEKHKREKEFLGDGNNKIREDTLMDTH